MQGTQEIALNIVDLKKYYPGVRALDGLSFKVQRGTIHGLLGPNGAGKTTTMKIISGLIKESAGSFEVNGEIGYLAENPPLYQDMIVEDYLKFVAQIFGVAKKEIKKNVDEIINKIKITNVKKRIIGNLSKGQKQKVGMAMALVHKPEILIFDEPTVGLDPASVIDIRELFLNLRGEHTILLSTHLLHEVENICSHITVVSEGKALLSGSIDLIQKKIKNEKSITTIIAQVRSWKKDDDDFFKALTFIDRVEHMEKKENFIKFQLNLSADINEDPRSLLTKYLSERNCGLLSFTEEEQKSSLEEVFLKLVNK
ncbi:MAG: ABC transporter ATP-binding protein [Oligoflexia bacterium]|nr:ABC transporter ATP-binding protein [Oligoflexia bacterium]